MFKMGLFWHLNCILMLNWIVWNRTVFTFKSELWPVGWGYRIHWLFLCRGVRPHQWISDGEVPVMLERWEIWSTSSLQSLPGLLWSEVVTPIGSYLWVKENCLKFKQCSLTFRLSVNKRLIVNWMVWNRTVCSFNSE